MHYIILTIFLIVAIILIGLILIHHGYGIGISTTSTFTNASTTFFGYYGSKNFLNRIITLFAFIFIITTLILDNIVYNSENHWSNIKPPLDMNSPNK
ncbi:MAG: preprotein translocase subunit SecG [Candidatus Dasytiphilus stammeri]